MNMFLSPLLGAAIASAVFFVVVFVDNTIRPTPPELMNPATPEAVEKRVDSTPTSKWIAVLAGLALGAFVGGIAASKLAGEKNAMAVVAVGALLSPWAGYTFYVVYPAVLWVPFVMLLSVFLFPWLGRVVTLQFFK